MSTAWEESLKPYPDLPLINAHCDNRVLHAPGDCEYCDRHPEVQAYRIENGICFTGHTGPEMRALFDHERLGYQWKTCPADKARPPGSSSDHRRWGGNKPTTATGDPSWPAESFASVVMYGDHGGREPWPLQERVRRSAVRPLHSLSYWLRGYEKHRGYVSFGGNSRPRGGALGKKLAALLMRIR